jgi:hypothetical protein
VNKAVGVVAAVAVAATAAACTSSRTPAPSSSTSAGASPATLVWRQELRAIGQPQVVDGVAVVDAVERGDLRVVALDAATGKRLWSDGTSAGDVVPGIPVAPSTVEGKNGHHYVAYYRRDPSRNLSARLVVADLRTGKPLVVTPPAFFTTSVGSCDDDVDVCVTRSDLEPYVEKAVRLDLAKRRFVPEPDDAPTGSRDIGYGLLQSETEGPTTLSVRDGTRLRWEHPLKQLFPGGQTPDGGWSIHLDEKAQVYVVSIASGPRMLGKRENVTTALVTAGLDAKTGKRLWLEPGTWWQCHGDLMSYDADQKPYPVRCRYTGTVQRPGSPRLSDVKVEGFDVRTGRTTWSVDAGPLTALSGGEKTVGTVGRASATAVLLALPGRPSQVVDLATGKSRAPAAGETFVCTRDTDYASPESWYREDGSAEHLWQGGTLGEPCDATGTPGRGLPSWGAAEAVGTSTGDGADAVALLATTTDIVGLKQPTH